MGVGPREGVSRHSPEPAVGDQGGRERVHELGLRQRVEPSLPPQAQDAQDARLPVDPQLGPSDEPVPVQDRQDVVAPASLRLRDVDLPDVVEAVEGAQEVAVPDVRVERREEGDAGIVAAGPPDRPVGRAGPVRGAAPVATFRLGQTSSSAWARIGSSAVSRNRGPLNPSIATGVRTPASASSAWSTFRAALLSGSPPSIPISTRGIVPSQISALPEGPSRPWAR